MHPDGGYQGALPQAGFYFSPVVAPPVTVMLKIIDLSSNGVIGERMSNVAGLAV